YNTLLGDHYTWMFTGTHDLSSKFKENYDFFTANGIENSTTNAHAVDLGAGNGMQTIPLVELGYRVHAIDLSENLLKDLTKTLDQRGFTNSQVSIYNADLCDFPNVIPIDVQHNIKLVVCMGDTLPHLPSRTHVRNLINNIGSHLLPNGRLILSFRELIH